MIRDDFKKGGFPVNRQAPVLCYTAEGKLYVAYDNYTLKTIFSNAKVVKCVGVWPGKKGTDVFRLSPDSYGIHTPPVGYQNIDNAVDIQVELRPDGTLKEITYLIEENCPISTNDENLWAYIKSIGLKHKVRYDK